MATANELRASIDQRHQELRAALEAAGARWEVEPATGEWTARQTAEHAIGMERMYAGLVAEALSGDAPGGKEIALASAQDALTALEEAIGACAPVLQSVSDADLSQAAELKGEVPSPDIPKTVEGVLWLNAFHIDDHAKQIAAIA